MLLYVYGVHFRDLIPSNGLSKRVDTDRCEFPPSRLLSLLDYFHRANEPTLTLRAWRPNRDRSTPEADFRIMRRQPGHSENRVVVFEWSRREGSSELKCGTVIRSIE